MRAASTLILRATVIEVPMNSHLLVFVAGLISAVYTGGPAAVASEPADAAAAVPPSLYQSPFANYRALREDINTPWREANDTVAKVGGWRAYAREAADATKAREAAAMSRGKAASPPALASPPKPAEPAKPGTPAVTPAPSHKHGG
jgi:hypothetical protein